jgi:hypothetical protein
LLSCTAPCWVDSRLDHRSRGVQARARLRTVLFQGFTLDQSTAFCSR